MLLNQLLLCLFLVSTASATNEYFSGCLLRSDAIVQFFHWRWTDVMLECQRFLPYRFCAAQVSPPTEHPIHSVTLPPPIGQVRHSWYERYEQVTHKVTTTDSGTGDFPGAQFDQMVQVCKDNGIRIYADIEINHMTDDLEVGYGSDGSYYDGATQSYPSIPYMAIDFHQAQTPTECPTNSGSIEDPNNPTQVRMCKWRDLNDLKTETQDVRANYVAMMNKLIDKGVGGFRIAHARFVQPADIDYIVQNLKNLSTDFDFPANTRPFIYQEVIDDGSGPIRNSEYSMIGRTEEVKAGRALTDVVKRVGDWKLANLTDWGHVSGRNIFNLSPDETTVVYVDDPASQRGFYTDVDNQILMFRNTTDYEIANVFLLTWPYGYPRVLSSYDWAPFYDAQGQDLFDFMGPPRNTATDQVLQVAISADGLGCEGDWNCEHRWRPINQAVIFHNLIRGTEVRNWWSNGYHMIAYGRGNSDQYGIRGFVAINNELSLDMDYDLFTGMDAGTYCDVMTGESAEPPCSGRVIVVDSEGWARFYIPNRSVGDNPMIVIRKMIL